MARKKFSKEEKKQMRKEQRQKDALRSYRCRGFKNFLFWLTGVLTSVVLIITALFAGVAVIPIRVYLGDNADGVVSNDVSSKSFLNAILKAETYDMSDFPFVADALDDFIKDANLDEYVEIDVERIKTLKFDETFTTELQSCIKVVATLESVGGKEVIGDIGNLEILNEWEEVKTENLPTTDADGNITKDQEKGELTSNPKLYYYYHVETEGASLLATRFDAGKGEWRRAFDDDGKRIPESIGQTLYFANISQVPLLDVVDLIDETLGRLKLTDLLSAFGGAEFGEDSLVSGLLGDKTISQIGDITADNIMLTAILPYEDNAEIYKILLQVCGAEIEDWTDTEAVKEVADTLNINSFGNLSFENVALATFLPYEDNKEIYKILLQVCGVKIENWEDADLVKAEAEKLNINSFGNLSFESLSLTTFLPYEDNADIYKILLQICGVKIENWEDVDLVKAEAEKLGIDSFANLSFENVTLTTFLPYEDNADLYKVLLQMCGNDLTGLNETEIQALAKTLDINSFGELEFENVVLTTFLPYGENADLYKILLQMCGNDLTGLTETEIEDLAKTLNINSFSKIEFDNLALTTFLPYKDVDNGVDNSEIYKILLQACGNDLTGLSDIEIEELAKELNVNSFEKLDFNNISIGTLGIDEDTAKILIEAVNAKITEDNDKLPAGEEKTPLLNDVNDLTVSHLTMLDPDYIKLSSLLPYSSNTNLYKIILQACGNNLTGLTETQIEALANGLGVNAFNDINFNNVSLTTFLPYKDGSVDNTELYKILLQACGNDLTGLNDTAISNLANGLNINAFGDIDFNNVTVSTFGLGGETLDLLLNAINGKIAEENAKPGAVQKPLLTAKQLTVGHLLTLDTNYITLSSVLSYESNKDMYKIILQACGNDLTGLDDTAISNLASKLSISAFNDIDFNKVSISTFGIQGNTLTLLYNAVNGKIAEENAKPDAVQKPLLTSESQLTVNHLINFDAKYIKLSTVLPYEDENKVPMNTALYNILLDVINGENGTKTADDITVSDLANFNANSIKLNNIMPKTAENQALYEILLDVINSDKKAGDIGYLTYDKITINCLTKFSFDDVKLWHVLPYENKNGVPINTALYSILLDVINGETGTKTEKDIKISDLSTFSFEMVRLSTVMPKTESNAGLYNILLDIINGDKMVGDDGYVAENKITINHLSNFDVVGIKLNTVMPKTDSNASLYNVLLDVINGDKKAGDSGYVSYDKITISNLSSFGFENVKLSTVLPYEDKNGAPINTGLYDVLLDVINSGKAESEKLSKDDLKISHLSSFSVSNIRLQTVLGNEATGNVILDKLIAKDVAVSGLATAINGLSLYEVYGQNCFVKSDATGIAKYALKEDENGKYFELDENGEYAINKKSGIWLFLCFDSVGVDKTAGDTFGCAIKYYVSTATLQTLTEANSGSSLSGKITSATIRQLVDSGILSTAHQDIYDMTLNDIATSDIWKYLALLPK